MNSLSLAYRDARRQIDLPAYEKELFLKLLREISVNAVRRQKVWHIKEDFMTLWFISAGRFPVLAVSPFNTIIGKWVAARLPFELNEDERNSLWI